MSLLCLQNQLTSLWQFMVKIRTAIQQILGPTGVEQGKFNWTEPVISGYCPIHTK